MVFLLNFILLANSIILIQFSSEFLIILKDNKKAQQHFLIVVALLKRILVCLFLAHIREKEKYVLQDEAG